MTRETFLAWRNRFLKENVGNLKGPCPSHSRSKGIKLTGKQLFEQNKALASSDAAFADDGIAVESTHSILKIIIYLYISFVVDESAFEGINLDDFNEDGDEVVYDNRGQISDDEN